MDMGEFAGHRMKIEIFNDHVMCLTCLEYKGPPILGLNPQSRFFLQIKLIVFYSISENWIDEMETLIKTFLSKFQSNQMSH